MTEIVKPLRPYQGKVIAETYNYWNQGSRCVLIVMPTGAGKTRVLTEVAKLYSNSGWKVIIQVHRGELVYQISQALAEQGILHTFYAADKDAQHCGNLHVRTFGRSFVSSTALVAVASVPTMNARYKKAPTAFSFDISGTGLVIPDEAHHTLKNNTFGILYPLLPDARWMGVTATPRRTDGQGLGSMAQNGIFDSMVIGPRMRDLIHWGNLCDYDIYEPPVNAIEQIDWGAKDLQATAGGDINAKKQAAVLDKPTITGDLVQHYLDGFAGRLMVTFCCDVHHATSVTEAYRARGVPSEFLHGGNSFSERQATLDRYRSRQTLVLNTVDLVSEGFDLPAIEGMAYYRRSLSLSWYLQTIGRVLRPMEGKGKAFILDHVGNFREHGLPDKMHHWQLGDYKRVREGDEEYANDIPTTRCRAFDQRIGRNCNKVYQINNKVCPSCGNKQPVTEGGGPRMLKVDGKLRLVSPEEMAALRGDMNDVDDQHVLFRNETLPARTKLAMAPEEVVSQGGPSYHPSAMVRSSVRANHQLWQTAIRQIGGSIDTWMRYHAEAGFPKHAAQTMFLRKFGVDVYNAQTLKPKDAHELNVRISDANVAISEQGLPYDLDTPDTPAARPVAGGVPGILLP